ncbi:hypothetical protein [Streptomyces sp. C10-9-1]|uniref:hypothetical protein n=1 Tax=Streptomyces sp. C10-9-1 TaxID=1859285 RepID=UPI003D766333
MRGTDPGLRAIRDALATYDLTTPPTQATTDGRLEVIAEQLTAAGYTLRPARRRLLPAGARRTYRTAYTGAVVTLAVAIVLGGARLWIPALGLVLAAAWLADVGDRHRTLRRRARAAEQRARPVDRCGAGTTSLVGHLVGPCVLRHGHGPVHQDAAGTTWGPRMTGGAP